MLLHTTSDDYSKSKVSISLTHIFLVRWMGFSMLLFTTSVPYLGPSERGSFAYISFIKNQVNKV